MKSIVCSGWQWVFLLCLLLGIVTLALPARATSDDASLSLSSPVEREVAHRILREATLIDSPRFAEMPRYDLKLEIDENLTDFSVSQKLSFLNSSGRSLRRIVLHVPINSAIYSEGRKSPLKIVKITLNGSPAIYNLNEEILSIDSDKDIAQGERSDIFIQFQAAVPVLKRPPSLTEDGLAQLTELFGGGHKHARNYGVISYSNEILSLGHWYAILPHQNGAAFDEIRLSGTGDAANFDAAHYRVELIVPKDLVVVTSGIDLSEELKSGRKTITSVALGVREYTVSASTKFSKSSEKAEDVTVNCYVKAKNNPQCKKLIEYAKDAITQFGALFGPYPYRELDIVEAPLRGGAGGMEYSGLVTVGSGLFETIDFSKLALFKDVKSIAQDNADFDLTKDVVEFTLAHEIAHQWWHGLVGNDAKQAPFIDESLTNYSTIMYFENKYGKHAARKQQYLQLELIYQLYRILGNKDVAVVQPAGNFSDTLQYGSIVYSKGALFYSDLRKRMGDEAFFAMLRRYAGQNQFGFATYETLKSAIKEGAQHPSSQIKLTDAERLTTRWLEGLYGDADIGVLEVDRFAEMILGPQIFEGEDGLKARMILKLIGPLAIALE